MARLVLFLVLFFAFILVAARADNSPTGRWEGVIEVPGRDLHVVVDLAPADGSSWKGSITMPGLIVKGAELNEISCSGSNVQFAIKDALNAQLVGPAKFVGNLQGEGMLRGIYTQAGNTAPFHLTRIGDAQVELPPRSTVVAKELEGEWKGDYELMGYARHVTLKFANRGENGASAEWVVVGKRVNNLPVDLVTQDGDYLTVDSHQTGLGFEGRFDKKAREIKGLIKQGPIETPLTLRPSA